MPKNQPSELIATIQVGSNDPAGNVVINVLAISVEYVIYEIEHSDVNNQIKVLVDGVTQASELMVTARFNTVKQRYIEAKGLLGKTSNYGMMKHRIAHTLSTCLSTDDVDGINEFDELIATITKEHEAMVTNRVIYLIPCMIATLCLFVTCLLLLEQRQMMTPTWLIISSLLAASLGGSISILAKTKMLNFEEFKTKKHYFLLGTERIFLSFVAAAIMFIGIKSGLLFPTLLNESYWPMMMMIVVSGFSESFVPGILDKVNHQTTSQQRKIQ